MEWKLEAILILRSRDAAAANLQQLAHVETGGSRHTRLPHSRQRCVVHAGAPFGCCIASAAPAIMFFVSNDGQHGLRRGNDFCSLG